MNFRAYVDQGLWATEVRKLAKVTGKTIEETIRAQARLLVRDCILLTPPCPKTSTESGSFGSRLKEQLRIGQKAIAKDVRRVFVPAESRKLFSIRGSERGDRLARQLAKIAATGDVGKLNEVIDAAGYGSRGNKFSEITRGATRDKLMSRRTDDGKTNWKGRRVLIHTGKALPYNPEYETSRGWAVDASIQALVMQLSQRIGRAKAGWAPAAKQLKLGLPKWIKANAKGGEGFLKIEGEGTPKIAVTVASTVPYMQRKGAAMRIVERAWAMRHKKIQTQRRAFQYGKGKWRERTFQKWLLTRDQEDKA